MYPLPFSLKSRLNSKGDMTGKMVNIEIIHKIIYRKKNLFFFGKTKF